MDDDQPDPCDQFDMEYSLPLHPPDPDIDNTWQRDIDSLRT